MLLPLLLSMDLAFAAIHLVYSYTPFLSDPLYSLERDRGYAEWFQYTKLFWLVLLCLLLASRQRALTYFAWALAFGVLFLTDAFTLHETYGWRLARTISLPPLFGLRGGDVGELMVLATIGVGILVVLAAAYRRADSPERRFTHAIVLLLGGLVFFGVVVDAAGSIFRDWSVLGPAFHTAEDAGEMLMVSVMLWVVFVHTETAFGGQPSRRWLPGLGPR